MKSTWQKRYVNRPGYPAGPVKEIVEFIPIDPPTWNAKIDVRLLKIGNILEAWYDSTGPTDPRLLQQIYCLAKDVK